MLMVDWHPRAIHFAPASNGWDLSLLEESPDEEDDLSSERPEIGWLCPKYNGKALLDADIIWLASRKRKLEEMQGASRRSDRMSWSVLPSFFDLKL